MLRFGVAFADLMRGILLDAHGKPDMNVKKTAYLLKDTFNEWNEDKAPRLGAALAYYSAFSIAPLVLLAIAAASLIFGPEAARGEVVDELKNTVGASVAEAVEQMLAEGHESGKGWAAAVLGVVTLLFGAAGVFGQLQDALNTVWKVAPKPGRGIMGIIHDRFLSLTMVLGTGFLLLISLILTAALSALNQFFSHFFSITPVFWQVINQLVAFAVITLLFAMIFRLLPDAQIAWRDVWMGAGLTAALFSLGKFLLGWYLGREGITSGFGAAGSLVILLLWVYYSSLLLLFGAEFTRVYAQQFGSGMRPAPNAVPVTAEARARQGMPSQEQLQGAAQRQERSLSQR
jgi:membrane protein